jgi:hypothetical protein
VIERLNLCSHIQERLIQAFVNVDLYRDSSFKLRHSDMDTANSMPSEK